MRKFVVLSALLLASFSLAREIVPEMPGTYGACYSITTVEELYGYVKLVNEGEDPDGCVLLRDDIYVNTGTDFETGNVAQWIPIGTAEHPFKGKFSGEYHTIYGIAQDCAADSVAGLFGYVAGGTEDSPVLIQRLGVENARVAGCSVVGGLAAVVDSNSYVSVNNAYSAGTFAGVLTAAGSVEKGVVGGLFGEVKGDVSIENSHSSAALKGVKFGGLVGTLSVDSLLHLKNAFSLTEYGAVNGKDFEGAEIRDSVQFANATVAKLLYEYNQYGANWRQSSGSTHPTLSEKYGGDFWYPYTLHYPNGEIKRSWHKNAVELDDGDDSTCYIGWYESPTFEGEAEEYVWGTAELWTIGLPRDKDGWCLIGNADDLYLYAKALRDKYKKSIDFKAKLTADIVVNKNVLDSKGNVNKGTFRSWNPIENAYYTIDGDGHVISGLYYSGEGDISFIKNFGLRDKPEDISIRNLGIVDSYLESTAKDNVTTGLFLRGNGNITLEKVFFEGTLVASGEYGNVRGLFNAVNVPHDFVVKNTHVKGVLKGSATSGFGGQVLAENVSVRESYFDGILWGDGGSLFAWVCLTGTSMEQLENVEILDFYSTAYSPLIKYTFAKTLTLVNVYGRSPDMEFSYIGKKNISNFFVIDYEPDSREITSFPAEKFRDGTVAALMRQNCVYGANCSVWGQNVEKGDTLPNFSGTINSSKLKFAKLTLKTFDDDPNASKYPKQYLKGFQLTLPAEADVIRDGYVFAGWYLSSDFSGKPITTIDSTETKDLTLYAKFVSPLIITLVEYEGKEQIDTVGKGIAWKTKRVEREGYVFAGWYDNPDFTGPLYGYATIQKNDTLYAKWYKPEIPPLVEDCYQVSTVEQLYGLDSIYGDKTRTDACVELVDDIVLNKNVLKKDESLNDSLENVLTKWKPPVIVGVFDGKGHSISGLYYDEEYAVAGVGFFERANGEKVSIRNLGIKDAFIRCNGNVAGGIVGVSETELEIANSFFEGTLYSKGKYGAGGLVGDAINRASKVITIVNSYHIGPVTSEYGFAGGLIGRFSHYSKAEPSFVEVVNSFHAGRLASGEENYKECNEKSLYCGMMFKSEYVSRIDNVYSLGKIPTVSRNHVSGVMSYPIEKFEDGTVAQLLHDYNQDGVDGSIWGQSSGRKYPDFSGNVKGFSPSYAKIEWHSYSSDKYPYPAKVLKGSQLVLPDHREMVRDGYIFGGWYDNAGFMGSPIFSMNVTKDAVLYANWIEVKKPGLVNGCYQISSAEELYGFARVVNQGDSTACGELTRNITINQNVLDSNGNPPLDAEYGFAHWTPIGNENCPFSGKFEGNGYTISGLYQYALNEYGGLFGVVNGGSAKDPVFIHHLGISDSYFRGGFDSFWSNTASVVGGVSEKSYLKISRVYSTATVENGGGFVSTNEGILDIDSCYSLGKGIVSSYDASYDALIDKSYSGYVDPIRLPLVTNSYCVVESRYDCKLMDPKNFDEKMFGFVESDTSGHLMPFTPFVNLKNPPVAIVASGKQIQVNGAAPGQKYAVLDMQGRVIYQGVAEISNFVLKIPRSGKYIVRVGKAMRPVLVK